MIRIDWLFHSCQQSAHTFSCKANPVLPPVGGLAIGSTSRPQRTQRMVAMGQLPPSALEVFYRRSRWMEQQDCSRAWAGGEGSREEPPCGAVLTREWRCRSGTGEDRNHRRGDDRAPLARGGVSGGPRGRGSRG